MHSGLESPGYVGGYSIQMFEQTFGISCVENYLVSYMIQNNLPYKAIYYKSFRPVLMVVKDFLQSHVNYTRYTEIERLQKESRDLQIVEPAFLGQQSFEEMLKMHEQEMRNGRPLLVKVNPEKLPIVKGMVPWRDDHFIMLLQRELDTIDVLDDYPRRSIKLDLHELSEAYSGGFIRLTIMNPSLDMEQYKKKVVSQIQCWGEYPTTNDLDSLLAGFDLEQIEYLRDAIGILRVSRKRMEVWIEWLSNIRIIDDFQEKASIQATIQKCDKLYGLLEVYRLRKKVNIESIVSIITEIVQMDELWTNELTRKINIMREG